MPDDEEEIDPEDEKKLVALHEGINDLIDAYEGSIMTSKVDMVLVVNLIHRCIHAGQPKEALLSFIDQIYDTEIIRWSNDATSGLPG